MKLGDFFIHGLLLIIFIYNIVKNLWVFLYNLLFELKDLLLINLASFFSRFFTKLGSFLSSY